VQETLNEHVEKVLETLSRTGGKLKIDSRDVKSHDVFLALKGERHDGHDFVNHAFENGAVLAIVEKKRDYKGSIIEVPSTLSFIRELALYRLGSRSNKTVVAITGSVGKTTTKELIWYLTGKTCFKVPGNLNTPIGLALSLINEYDGEALLILEYGVSYPGDMDEICRFVSPDVGVLLPVGSSHIGNFSSKEELLKEKLKLSEYAGKIVAHVSFKDKLSNVELFFGDGGDVFARILEVDPTKTKVEVAEKGRALVLTLPGVWHDGMVEDLSAAVAACRVLGMEPRFDCLKDFSTLEGRFRLFKILQAYVVDDTYNSSIESFNVASQMINQLWPEKEKVAVLGSILEQGKESPHTHEILLNNARRYFNRVLVYAPPGVDEILTAVDQEEVFTDEEELLERLREVLSKDVILYCKASHGVKLYHVVKKLKGVEGA